MSDDKHKEHGMDFSLAQHFVTTVKCAMQPKRNSGNSTWLKNITELNLLQEQNC
jgi:hypothetical protein